MKKSGEGGRKSEKAAGEKAPEKDTPKDFAEVRRNFANEVRLASNEILSALIVGAKGGQVAAAKYLYEVVGAYPASEKTLGTSEESIVYSLYKQLVEEHPSVAEADTEGDEAKQGKTTDAVAVRQKSETDRGKREGEIPEAGDEVPRREDAVE
jgi:hypothetical protein